jgi:hypothetical protein
MFGADTMKWTPRALVEKWDDDQVAWCRSKTGILSPRGDDLLAAGLKPYGIAESEGNLLTTAGLTRLMTLLNGAGGQAMTNTAVRLGVGNGAGSAAIGDTDLGAAAGAANRWFQVMDATYPSTAAGVLTAKATFATGDGNFAWNEWGLDIGSPTVSSSAVVSATLFNHKTSAALGTKTSGSWALTVTVTIS